MNCFYILRDTFISHEHIDPSKVSIALCTENLHNITTTKTLFRQHFCLITLNKATVSNRPPLCNVRQQPAVPQSKET